MKNKITHKAKPFILKNLFWSFFYFCIGVSTASSETLDEMPFELSPQGQILIVAHINGDGPFIFALDTGSGKTIISPNTNLFPSQPALSKTDAIQGHISKRMAHSETINQLSVGILNLDNFKVNVMSLGHITKGEFLLNGILGQDFLNIYDLEFDFPKRLLRFYTKAENLETCDICKMDGLQIPFENKFGGLLQLNLNLNDLNITGLLDTGTGLTTVNKSTVFALGFDMKTLRANETNQGQNSRRSNIDKIQRLIEADRNRSQRRENNRKERFVIKNVDDDEYLSAPRSNLKEYRIPLSKVSYEGQNIKRHQSISYIELPVFRKLGFGAQPFALFGTDLFQSKTLRISNGMKLISISNSEIFLLDP